MADVTVTVEAPEAPPSAQEPTTQIPSENSSTAMEVGRLMERMQTMETELTETKAAAEAAESRARNAETEAAAANDRAAAAEAAAAPPVSEPIVEPIPVPVVLEEIPSIQIPKRGRLVAMFLGRN